MVFDGHDIWVADSGGTNGGLRKMDPATGRLLVRWLPVGTAPQALAFDGRNIWVTNYADYVSEIDPRTAKILRRVWFGGDPTGDIAASTDNVWVGQPPPQTIGRIDVGSGRKAAVARRFPGANLLYARGRLFGNDGGRLLVQVNPTTGGRVGHMQFRRHAGLGGMAMVGRHVWVALTEKGEVDRVDVAKHRVTAAVRVGGRPTRLAFDGKYLWAVNASRNDVAEIDPRTTTVLRTVNVGFGPYDIAFDGRRLWVSDSPSARGDVISEIDERPRT